MNPTVHAEISAKRRGGTVADWFPAHSFMDASKEVESSNLHRVLSHHLFFVRRVMVPIFGATLKLTGGGKADLKDALEMDHLAEDYRGFIPALEDYVSLIKDDPADRDLVQQFDLEHAAFYNDYPQVREYLLHPLAATGSVKACLITLNSWSLNYILPKVFPGVPLQIKDFGVKPSALFGRMEFADWINNGRGAPPSAAKIIRHRKSKIAPSRPAPVTEKDMERAMTEPILRDMVFDGNRNPTVRDMIVDGRRPSYPLDMSQVYIDGGAGPAGGCHPFPRKDKPDHLVD